MCWEAFDNTGNGGNPGGLSNVEVMLYTDGGNFFFTASDGSVYNSGWQNAFVVPGTTLTSNNISITDATKQGYIFDMGRDTRG